MIVYLKLLLTALFWGGTFLAGRIIAPVVPLYTAAFFRFVIASLCLVWIARRMEGGLPALSRESLISVILLGLTGVFAYNVLFFTGMRTVTAGRAGAIVAINPVVIALFGALFFKERLTLLKMAGILLSVAGAIIVISKGDYRSLTAGGISMGDWCVLGCAVSWIIYSLLGKRAMNKLSPLSAVTYSCIAGTALLFVPALMEGMIQKAACITLTGWAGIIYLGLFGTAIGFTWYYQGIKAIGAAKAGVFLNFVPVSAIVCGYIFLREPVDFSLAAGVACIIAGTYMTNSNPDCRKAKGTCRNYPAR